ARARALECVADVLEPELLRPGEIGGARPRQCHRLRPLSLRLALGRTGAHPPGPVFVIAVADAEREGRPERPAMAQTRKHPAPGAAAPGAVARPPASYARSTTVCPARGSTSSSSRAGVAFTIRSPSEASGGQASLRENSCTSPGSAGNIAFAAPPAPIRQTRLASRPATIALSVLKPSRRPPRQTSVFTEGPSASSQSSA